MIDFAPARGQQKNSAAHALGKIHAIQNLLSKRASRSLGSALPISAGTRCRTVCPRKPGTRGLESEPNAKRIPLILRHGDLLVLVSPLAASLPRNNRR